MLVDHASEAASAATAYLDRVRAGVSAHMATRDRDTAHLEQRRLHGLAWIASTVEALRTLDLWARRSLAAGRFGDGEQLILQVAFGEYLAQLTSALPMSQSEMLRPGDVDAASAAADLGANPAVAALMQGGNAANTRRRLTRRLDAGWWPDEALDDETLELMRQEIRTFVAQRIAPSAHAWHLADALIPDDLVREMSELGVFGVCISTDHGGIGLGKLAMCIVSEELSRGWIAAGSLGTRSEIASELIALAGTPEQQAYWLPRIASGEVLPAAVFTEPGAGSDLADVRTRATLGPSGWRVNGAKLWITHAARSDLYTILARTDDGQAGFAGLSILLAEKTRGTETDPFPDDGLFGSAIDVLGYRGMREYALSFEDFEVSPDGLLGAETGLGFKQLMRTFESARIQTAARALGVGRAAFEAGLKYARDRRQFGRSLLDFPRVADKLVLSMADLLAARELTYAAARSKDLGERCDREAGIAKLMAARAAWSTADSALQIHGGAGYALESEISRIFCDARVLSIFEGASEVQANVIGRALVETR